MNESIGDQAFTDVPVSRQVGAVARGFMGIDQWRMLVAQIAGIVAITLAIPWTVPKSAGPIELVTTVGLSAVAYALLGIGIPEVLRRPRQRAAYESFLWIGRWDYLRALATGMGQVPRSMDEMRQWLAAHAPRPDQAIIRIEGLVWTGDFATAAAAVESLPEDTPWQRFEKELHRAFVAFIARGDDDLSAACAASRELKGLERTRADTVLAVEETRHRIAAGDPDWIAPLVEVRPRIGAAADHLTLTDLGRRQLPIYLALGGGIGIVTLFLAGHLRLPFG